MSTQNEITRLQTARNKLRTKGVELGINTNTDKLDVIATAYEGIENRGAVTAQVQEGESYTIPKGYHNGSGTVSGVKGGGNYSLQSKKATPTKKQQNITPDAGYYGLSDVTFDPIPDNFQDVSPVTAGAADVLANKVIVSATGETVAGTMPNNGKVTKTLAAGESVAISKGYHDGTGSVSAKDLASQTPGDAEEGNVLDGKEAWVNGSKVTGTMPNIGAQTASINAGGSVTISKGYHDGTGKITGNSLASQTPGDAAAANILAGKKAWVAGSQVTGTMPNNGATSGTIDGLTTMSMRIPAGYTTGGTVSLTSDIEEALAAI